MCWKTMNRGQRRSSPGSTVADMAIVSNSSYFWQRFGACPRRSPSACPEKFPKIEFSRDRPSYPDMRAGMCVGMQVHMCMDIRVDMRTCARAVSPEGCGMCRFNHDMPYLDY